LNFRNNREVNSFWLKLNLVKTETD
jgi:hypothetical protein